MQSVLRKPEIAHDVGAQPAARVQRVDVEALAVFDRRQLAAGFRAALEHEHLAAGLRQIGGCHQSVVTCADDDDVGVRHAGT